MDIKSLKIFKDFSNVSKKVFKTKPVTTEIITLINTRKDKNIDNNRLKKIKEYACMINNLYTTLEKHYHGVSIEKEKIYDLISKYRSSTDTKKKEKKIIY